MDAAIVLRLLAAVAILAARSTAAASRGAESHRRLLGGNRARDANFAELNLEDFDYPFYVSLSDPGSGGRVCAGVLVGFSAVATAAHCVDPAQGGVDRPIAVIGPPGAPYEDVEIRDGVRAVLHPEWDGDPLHGHDAAIVILDKPADVRLAMVPRVEPTGGMFSIRLDAGVGGDEICRRPHFLERDPSLRACTGRVQPRPCMDGAGTPLMWSEGLGGPHPHYHATPYLSGVLSFVDCGSGTPVFTRAGEFRVILGALRRRPGRHRRGLAAGHS